MQLRLTILCLVLSCLTIITPDANATHTKQCLSAINTAADDNTLQNTTPRSAQDGVNLLEHILQKMNNLPQIAIIPQPDNINAAAGGAIEKSNINLAQRRSPSVLASSIPIPKSEFEFRAKSSDRVTGYLLRKRDSVNLGTQKPISTRGYANLSDAKTNIATQESRAYLPTPVACLPACPKTQASKYIAPSTRYKINDFRQPVSAGLTPFNTKPTLETNETDLALLPPTVITGINFIRLGNSEQEVTKAINGIGNLHIKKEAIHNWSVWSLRKAKSADCIAQIFIRQGIVEAIRVFDSSFLQPDLGVKLGDGLSAVKEKFGEPAFIITDNTQATSQNYIYPISQIGFQFSRPSTSQSPQITSLIVFNVR